MRPSFFVRRILALLLTLGLGLPSPSFALRQPQPETRKQQAGLEAAIKEGIRPTAAGMEEKPRDPQKLLEAKEAQKIFGQVARILNGRDTASDFLWPAEYNLLWRFHRGQIFYILLKQTTRVSEDRFAALMEAIERAEGRARLYHDGERTLETLPRLARVILRYGIKQSRGTPTARHPAVEEKELELFSEKYWDPALGSVPAKDRETVRKSLGRWRGYSNVITLQDHLPSADEMEKDFARSFDDIEAVLKHPHYKTLRDKLLKKQRNRKNPAVLESEQWELLQQLQAQWRRLSLETVEKLIQAAPMGKGQPIGPETPLRISDRVGKKRERIHKEDEDVTLGRLGDWLSSSSMGIVVERTESGDPLFQILNKGMNLRPESPRAISQAIPWLERSIRTVERFLERGQYAHLFPTAAGLEETSVRDPERVEKLTFRLRQELGEFYDLSRWEALPPTLEAALHNLDSAGGALRTQRKDKIIQAHDFLDLAKGDLSQFLEEEVKLVPLGRGADPQKRARRDQIIRLLEERIKDLDGLVKDFEPLRLYVPAAGLEEQRVDAKSSRHLYDSVEGILHEKELAGEFLERNDRKALHTFRDGYAGIIKRAGDRKKMRKEVLALRLPQSIYQRISKIVQTAQSLAERYRRGERTVATLRILPRFILWYGLEGTRGITAQLVKEQKLLDFARKYWDAEGEQISKKDTLEEGVLKGISRRLLPRTADVSGPGFAGAFNEIEETMKNLPAYATLQKELKVQQRQEKRSKLEPAERQKELDQLRSDWRRLSLEVVDRVIRAAPRGEQQPIGSGTPLHVFDKIMEGPGKMRKEDEDLTLARLRDRLKGGERGLVIDRLKSGILLFRIFNRGMKKAAAEPASRAKAITWLRKSILNLKNFMAKGQYANLFPPIPLGAGLEERMNVEEALQVIQDGAVGEEFAYIIFHSYDKSSRLINEESASLDAIRDERGVDGSLPWERKLLEVLAGQSDQPSSLVFVKDPAARTFHFMPDRKLPEEIQFLEETRILLDEIATILAIAWDRETLDTAAAADFPASADQLQPYGAWRST
ncbi:MAG: hypothetical protein HY211_00005 [Candidatus Omnitrophica bacterium]|nr:hypothetical protein [Candidatus Omnitrophota bacterium]